MVDEDIMDEELENVDLADALLSKIDLDQIAETEEDLVQPVEDTQPPEPVIEDEPVSEVLPPPAPVVEVVEVDNPNFVAYDPALRDMMRRFVDVHLKVPSITYETFHGFICAVVDKIAQGRLAKMKDRDIPARFVIGKVNGVLAGFMLCSMRPNRMPCISTMEVTYIYSEEIHLSNEFVNAMAKYKKLWRAKWIACIPVNDRVSNLLSRILTGYQVTSHNSYGLGIKQRTVNRVVDAL